MARERHREACASLRQGAERTHVVEQLRQRSFSDDVLRLRDRFRRQNLSAPKLGDNRMRAEPIGDHLGCPFEVRTDLIHLVDEAEARHVEAVGLTPHRFRLGLDAGDRGKYRNRAWPRALMVIAAASQDSPLDNACVMALIARLVPGIPHPVTQRSDRRERTLLFGEADDRLYSASCRRHRGYADDNRLTFQLAISLSKTRCGSSTSTSRLPTITQIRVATARTKARSWLTRRQAAPCSINSLSSMSWPSISR